MKTLLITGVGGPTPRSFAQSLRKYSKYSSYHLIGTDANKYALGLYMDNLFNKTYLVPPASHPEYWASLNEIIRKEAVEHAVILPEVEVLEWARYATDHELPCNALIPDYRLAEKLVDKAFVADVLTPEELAPLSFSIEQNEKITKETIGIAFPFWIRSAFGSSGLGSLMINNMDELKNWMLINPRVEKFQISEYLPGRNLGCKMLYHNGELLRSAIAERVYYIMSKVAPSGITGNTAFGRLVNDEEVFKAAKRAMELLFEATNTKAHGFFTVDFKEDGQGKPLVTEVNIRFVAFTQCYAAGGANIPEDYIRVLDKDPRFDRTFKLYEFEKDLIFLRDVDEQPIIMKESDLFTG
jgi:carbamoyl-phosphate synthase large subunit